MKILKSFLILAFTLSVTVSARAEKPEQLVLKIEKTCEFQAKSFGRDYKKELTLYTSFHEVSPGVELTMITVDSVAVMGTTQRHTGRFEGGNEYNSVTLIPDPQTSGEIKFVAGEQPADTTVIIKTTSSRGDTKTETLRGTCGFITGGESIGAHN